MKTGTALDLKPPEEVIKTGRLPVPGVLRTSVPQVNPKHFRSLTDLYQVDSDVQRSVLRHVELALNGGVSFQSKDQRAAETLKQRLFYMTMLAGYGDEQQWLFKITLDLMLYANAFLHRRSSKANTGLASSKRTSVVSYDIIPPETISFEFDDNKKLKKILASKIEYNPKDVFHLSIFQPSGHMFGISPYFAMIDDVMMTRGMEDLTFELLKKNAHPILHAQVGVNRPISASQREIDEVGSNLRNLDPHSGFVVTQGHTILKMIGSESQALRTEGHLDRSRKRSLSGMNLPFENDRVMVIPQAMKDRVELLRTFGLRLLESTVFLDILMEEGFNPLSNPEHSVRLSFNPVSLTDETKFQMHNVQLYVQGFSGLNEQRVKLGMKPVDDIEPGSREDFFMERERIPMAEMGIRYDSTKYNPESASET